MMGRFDTGIAHFRTALGPQAEADAALAKLLE
jgi:hypothetical protein